MIKKRIGKIFSLVNKKSSKPLIMFLVVAVLGTGFLIGCEREEDLTDKLYENKTQFIGDNSKVGAIVTSLEYPKGYEYDHIEIFPEERGEEEGENQLSIFFKEDNKRKGSFANENEFLSQSAILFSLIDNLDKIVYITKEEDGETAFVALDREIIDNFTTSVLGNTSKNIGNSKDKFKDLVDYYEKYQNEPVEDIIDIGNITNSTGELSLNIKPDSVTSKGLTLIIENNSEKTYSYGSDFILYKRLGDSEWEEMKDPLISEEDDADIKEDNISDMEEIKINSKEKLEHDIQWDSFGELDKGEYLIIKKILRKESENNYESYSLGTKFDIKSSSSKPSRPDKPSGELELDETINSLSGVKMAADPGTVSANGMNVRLMNDSMLEYIFSEDFFIQKKTSKGWEDVKTILKKGQYGFNDIALVLPPGDDVDWKVEWKWLYDSLDKGDYRIVKQVIGNKAPGEIELHYLGAEFEIK